MCKVSSRQRCVNRSRNSSTDAAVNRLKVYTTNCSMHFRCSVVQCDTTRVVDSCYCTELHLCVHTRQLMISSWQKKHHLQLLQMLQWWGKEIPFEAPSIQQHTIQLLYSWYPAHTHTHTHTHTVTHSIQTNIKNILTVTRKAKNGSEFGTCRVCMYQG